MPSASQYLRPDVIAQVQRLDLRARFIVEGFMTGLHRSPFHGFSVEFSEHRKYVPGDDPRLLDWSVLARTDRLYVRKYQAETNLQCHLVVDASESMAYPGPGEQRKEGRESRRRSGSPSDLQRKSTSGIPGGEPGDSAAVAALSPEGMTKLDYAICLAAALGYLMIHQQDAVGLAIFASNLRTLLPPRSRRSHLMRIIGELAATRPGRDRGGKGLAEALHEIARRVHKRGLIIVLSDFLAEPEPVLEALHHLHFRGHDMILFQVLDWTEAEFPFDHLSKFEDPETGHAVTAQPEAVRAGYLAALKEFTDRYRHEAALMRADFVQVNTAMTFDRALVEFLLNRQHQF